MLKMLRAGLNCGHCKGTTGKLTGKDKNKIIADYQEEPNGAAASTQKRPPEKRGRGLMQNESGLLDTDSLPIRAAVENPPVVCEAAPTGCPVVICFASCIGSQAFSS